MPLVLHWRRQGLTESTRPEYRFVPESRIRSLDFSPGVLSASELLSNSFRLGDAMSLCCFSQEQQQQRQSALLATGDRALLVPTHHALCFSGCISQDQLSTPWRTAGPSFAASRHSSGLLLRSATSRVALSCGNLGLRLSPAASFATGGNTRAVPRLGRRCPCSVHRDLFGIFTAKFSLERSRPVSRHSGLSPCGQSEFNTAALCCRLVAGSPK